MSRRGRPIERAARRSLVQYRKIRDIVKVEPRVFLADLGLGAGTATQRPLPSAFAKFDTHGLNQLFADCCPLKDAAEHDCSDRSR